MISLERLRKLERRVQALEDELSRTKAQSMSDDLVARVLAARLRVNNRAGGEMHEPGCLAAQEKKP